MGSFDEACKPIGERRMKSGMANESTCKHRVILHDINDIAVEMHEYECI